MESLPDFEPTPDELAMVAQGYAMRQLYWPSYTWDIQTKHLNILDEKKQVLKSIGIDVEVFGRQRSDLFDKINASFYHLQKLKENENTVISLGKKMAESSKKQIPQGVFGIIGTPYEPINYEYEALLVTLKSGLDILAMMLACPSGLKSDNIGSLINDITTAKNSNEFFLRVKALISEAAHTKILDEFKNKGVIKSKRNYAVHQGSLPTGNINIQYASNSANIGVIKTRTLNIAGEEIDFSKQQNLDDYSEALFYSTCDFIIDGLEILIGEKLPKGDKSSVYESRLNSKSLAV